MTEPTGQNRDRPCVCLFAPLPYDHTRSRKHGLIQAAHRVGYRAIYVEAPTSRSPYTSDGQPPSLTKPGVSVETPDGVEVLCLPKKWRIGPARIGLSKSRMDGVYRRWLTEVWASISHESGATLGIVANAQWGRWLEEAQFDALVYDKNDEPDVLRRGMPASEYLAREAALLQRSDLLIAPSEPLLNAGLTARPNIAAALVPNGVDVEDFEAGCNDPVPELDGVTEPVIGFLGTVGHYIDVDLIEQAARAYPNFRFCVVGRTVSEDLYQDLRSLPNVSIWGPVDYARVPSIMNRFTVCLIPFRSGPISDSANPVKFYEYLSLGKPIVMTPMPPLSQYGELCYMTRSAFIEAIQRAVDEKDAEMVLRRKETAQQFTWSARFERIVDALPHWPSAQ